jgi:class 3 adenylate cyclase
MLAGDSRRQLSVAAERKRKPLRRLWEGCNAKFKVCAQAVINNPVTSVFTAVLTVGALTTDDIRVAWTNQPADHYFNVLVCVYLVVFTTEICLSWIGKEDYPWSFFACLDMIATTTLIFDLTIIQNLLAAGSSEMRSSRAVRVGTKVARVVRVIRLIRIVKLYKVVMESRMRELYTEEDKKKRMSFQKGDSDAYWLQDLDKEEDEIVAASDKENLVGKKLGTRTTRAAILLVLCMLIALPILKAETDQIVQTSASYGAEEVIEAFRAFWRSPSSTNLRDVYDESVLRYVYYHNWFEGRTGNGDCPGYCPGDYYSHIFWFGVAGRNAETLEALQLRLQLGENAIERWYSLNESKNYGTMPSTAEKELVKVWNIRYSQNGYHHLGLSLLGTQIDGIAATDYLAPLPSDLRPQEQYKYFSGLASSSDHDDYHFVFYFDRRPQTQAAGQFNLVLTFFVCIVLCFAAVAFTNDANRLVLAPLQLMINRVEAIRDNPLAAMDLADGDFKKEQQHKIRDDLRNKQKWGGMGHLVAWFASGNRCRRGKEKELLETAILEKTIIKLGSLLALGFGEAGTDIVSNAITGSSITTVDVMGSGTKVNCIIGNARIRDFSTASVVLGRKVTTFVNQVAEIVHGAVDEYHGATNTINRDTFVIVWRTARMTPDEVTREADMSVVAFGRILGAVHRSAILSTYRTHPGLQQRLGSNCRVNITFGLHYGWAIEGAVGSEFKIDASYVSPNVSLAARIEFAARLYRVSILLSRQVVDLLSDEMVDKLRLIDKVSVKGFTDPFELYCMDLDYKNIMVDIRDSSEKTPTMKSDKLATLVRSATTGSEGTIVASKTSSKKSADPARHVAWNARVRYRVRQHLKMEKEKKSEVNLPGMFDGEGYDGPDLYRMRMRYTDEFLDLFGMGYQNYSQGEWSVAKRLLGETATMLGLEDGDGPSHTLLRYMEKTSFVPPETWQGVHDLDAILDIVPKSDIS